MTAFDGTGPGEPNPGEPDADRPGVELDGVSVTFDGVTAVDDVSVCIDDGEFFTLVGPSGCGKTTTLRTIAGLESPDSGTVRIGGEDVTSQPPEDRGVGIVFQNYALFAHMNVRENVAYGLRFSDPPGGVSRGERVEELLAMVNMAEMGDREPTSLSGGQQQRVALARALAPGPEVLLLDEPLSALDARLRERLRVQVRALQRELGITTVYVTHDQAEALAVSDRVAVLDDGRVQQVDTPETVYREPATRFVAEFVGDNNVLDGRGAATDPPTASVDGVAVGLPAGAAVKDGASVTLSVRPEDVVLDPDGDPATVLEASVEAVEFLGDAYRVHCDWGGRTLLVKTAADAAPEGTVRLGIERERVHLL